MTKSLPLPPRFFKCPALTEREEQYLIGKAKESAKALVDATRNNEGPVRWEEAGMHRGVQMYKGEARYPESVQGDAIPYGCGATTIQSTLEEVAEFFDLSTDDKVTKFIETSDEVIDCQLLYVIHDPALLNDPRASVRTQRIGCSKMLHANQVTVKWFATDVSSKLMKNRDFLTVECQSTFLDVSGRRGWVRAYHSIKLPCCPALPEFNLVRASVYHTGYVFVESEKTGYLDVIFSAQVNMKGSVKVPAALYMTLQKRRLSGVAELQKALTRRRLGAHRFLGDLELVPKSQRTRCHLCSAKFGLMTRKARCRKCGEVVCSSACSTEWEVSLPGQGVRKVRVCLKCAQNTDPSVFEDLPPSEQYSGSNCTSQDDELPVGSARTGTHSYKLEDDEYDEYRQRRGPYTSSYEEEQRYSQDEGDLDDDTYPRTVEMLPGRGYASDSADYDDVPPKSRRRRDPSRRYDPRSPDLYDQPSAYNGSPSSRYMEDDSRRTLQRQQQHRATQKPRPSKQRGGMPRPHERSRRYDDSETYPTEFVRSMGSRSSNLSASYQNMESPNAPSFLTSSLLAQHTKQMGKPGPVTSTERLETTQRPAPLQRTKRRKARPEEPPAPREPPPALSTDRPLTRLEQLQVQQWMEQEAKFRQETTPPFDLDLDFADLTPRTSCHRRSSSLEESSSHRGPVLPAFFRSLHNQTPVQDHGMVTEEEILPPPCMSKTQIATSGQRTVSVADDEDGLETSINGLTNSFSSLLRPEDLRATEESMCLSLDSTLGLDFGTMGNSEAREAGEDSKQVASAKMAIVKLYQQVLELTTKQHELEAQPESDPEERKQVAQELDALYEQIHAHVDI